MSVYQQVDFVRTDCFCAINVEELGVVGDASSGAGAQVFSYQRSAGGYPVGVPSGRWAECFCCCCWKLLFSEIDIDTKYVC